jgi:hypothetical protein
VKICISVPIQFSVSSPECEAASREKWQGKAATAMSGSSGASVEVQEKDKKTAMPKGKAAKTAM